MKANLFILFLLGGSLSSSAQTKDLNYNKISDHILHNYHPDSVALSKFCRIGCVFIKFKVNLRGDIDSLSFSGDADSTQFITNALTTSVKSLRQDPILIDFLKHSGRMVIQPFTYNYQAGCNFPKAGTKNDSNYYLSYIDILTGMNTFPKSLSGILKFKDGNMPFFDGILLSPLVVSNAIMH